MNIVDFIKQFSAKTWSDIRFARNKVGVVRLGEVTLTHNLILSVAYEYYNSPNSIHLFEAKDEETNGNDIELFIPTSTGAFIPFPCQAKIVDKTDRAAYSKLSHANQTSGLQIDSLLEYASKVGGVPLYLFYNYSKEPLIYSDPSLYKEKTQHFGCSYVLATYLRHHWFDNDSWKKPLPTFSRLHPAVGKPFYRLFELCKQPKQDILAALAPPDPVNSNLPSRNIREYRLSELRESKAWQAIDYIGDGADIATTRPISARAYSPSELFTQQDYVPNTRSAQRRNALRGPSVFDAETGAVAAAVYAPKYRLIISSDEVA